MTTEPAPALPDTVHASDTLRAFTIEFRDGTVLHTACDGYVIAGQRLTLHHHRKRNTPPLSFGLYQIRRYGWDA